MLKLAKNIILLTFLFYTVIPAFSQINSEKSTSDFDNDEKLGAHYYSTGEFDKAVVIYENLYNKKPTPFYYSYYLNCLIELKDFKKAEKIVKKQGRLNKDSQKYIVELGYVYNKAKRPDKAKKQFELAIKELKSEQQNVIDLANDFLVRDEQEYAIKTYQKGRKILKKTYPFNFELAEIYEKKGDYQKMMNEYIELLDFNVSYLQNVQSKLQIIISEDISNNTSEALRNVLLDKVQKHPSNLVYPEMLLWFSIQKKDFKLALIQAKSLDKRYNEEGESVFQLASLIAANKDYDVAIDAYNYVIKKGENNFLYLSSKIRLLDVKYLKITTTTNFTKAELIELEKEFNSTIDELGKDASILPILKNLAHMQAFYLNKTDEAIKLLQEAINYKNAPKHETVLCKIELADIFLMSGEVWEATLLYSQVEKAFKNEPIGHLAKFKNAKLSYYIGEFNWAKTQLDVLKAATSKLIANDAMDLALLISDNIDSDSSLIPLQKFAKADLLVFQNKDELALAVLDSIAKDFLFHPLQDEILFKKSEVMIKKGKYEEAADYLIKITNNYSWDILADDALFKLAELNEHQFQKPGKAMELYQQIITNFPGSLYTVEARKRFRILREKTKKSEMSDEE